MSNNNQIHSHGLLLSVSADFCKYNLYDRVYNESKEYHIMCLQSLCTVLQLLGCHIHDADDERPQSEILI